MDMTSPVVTYVEPGNKPNSKSTFTMGFLVPEEYQDHPPSPVDKTIFIENRPDLTILTRYVSNFQLCNFLAIIFATENNSALYV